MAAKKKDDGNPVSPVIRVAPLGELKVYLVTEEELDALGRGSPGSIFLNFALALIPLSLSFFVTLLSTRIEATSTLVVFVCAAIVCFLVGLICAALAYKYHVSARSVVEKIKNRMPPPPPILQDSSESAPSAPSN